MEVDTGAVVSLQDTENKVVLSKPEIKLHTYTAQPISVMGKTLVSVEHLDYKGQQVVSDKSATLLGH